MEQNRSLADLLEEHMQERDIRDARLATLCNEIAQIHEFIHRSTIRNWRTGASKTVKDWRQLVVISSALRLDEESATRLLLAGSCASIRDLRAMATDEQQYLFVLWPEEAEATASVGETGLSFFSIPFIRQTSLELERYGWARLCGKLKRARDDLYDHLSPVWLVIELLFASDSVVHNFAEKAFSYADSYENNAALENAHSAGQPIFVNYARLRFSDCLPRRRGSICYVW